MAETPTKTNQLFLGKQVVAKRVNHPGFRMSLDILINLINLDIIGVLSEYIHIYKRIQGNGNPYLSFLAYTYILI